MATRYKNGSHYANHERAAELHDAAAHAHFAAAEAHEKQDHPSGHERSRQALEHSRVAFDHTGQIQPAVSSTFGHQEIAQRARELWQARGCPQGSPEQDWFEAARELRGARENSSK